MANEHAWLIEGATEDRQTTDASWEYVGRALIDGVVVREVRNVPKGNGMLTEIFRRDWFGEEDAHVDQAFQAVVESHCVSAWHAHAHTVDRLFVTSGTMRIVLYDSRNDSPTLGVVNEFLVGLHRPALIVVPPRVWHGVQNLSNRPGTILNLVDRAYRYEAPDHWRLPHDTLHIPFTFPLPPFGHGDAREQQGI